MVPGSKLAACWSHFRDLWAPKSHFFVICRGFVFRSKNNEFWNPKGIAGDPGAGQKDLPDITISKDLLSYLTRRIEASGQKAKCRRLRLNSRRLWPRGPPDIYIHGTGKGTCCRLSVFRNLVTFVSVRP